MFRAQLESVWVPQFLPGIMAVAAGRQPGFVGIELPQFLPGIGGWGARLLISGGGGGGGERDY